MNPLKNDNIDRMMILIIFIEATFIKTLIPLKFRMMPKVTEFKFILNIIQFVLAFM